MATPTRPLTAIPDWANLDPTDGTSGQPAIIAPSSTRINNGLGFRQLLPRQYLNWFWSLVGKWLAYFDAQINDISVGILKQLADISDVFDRLFAITGTEIVGVGPLTGEVETLKSNYSTLLKLSHTYAHGVGGTGANFSGAISFAPGRIITITATAKIAHTTTVVGHAVLADANVVGLVDHYIGYYNYDPMSGVINYVIESTGVGIHTGYSSWADPALSVDIDVYYIA